MLQEDYAYQLVHLRSDFSDKESNKEVELCRKGKEVKCIKNNELRGPPIICRVRTKVHVETHILYI